MARVNTIAIAYNDTDQMFDVREQLITDIPKTGYEVVDVDNALLVLDGSGNIDQLKALLQLVANEWENETELVLNQDIDQDEVGNYWINRTHFTYDHD
jgi:hypothetical protein